MVKPQYLERNIVGKWVEPMQKSPTRYRTSAKQGENNSFLPIVAIRLLSGGFRLLWKDAAIATLSFGMK